MVGSSELRDMKRGGQFSVLGHKKEEVVLVFKLIWQTNGKTRMYNTPRLTSSLSPQLVTTAKH